MAVIGIASGIAGLVTIAAQITQLTYSYISDVRNATRLQKEYLSEVSALTAVLLRAEQSCKDAEESGLLADRPNSLSADVLEQCRTQLAKLQADLEKPKMRLLWPLQERDMFKSIQSLQRFRTIFADFVSANAGIVAGATYRGVENLNIHQDIESLREWLRVSDGHVVKPPPVAYPGTGSWFLDTPEYREWTKHDEPSILWANGPPGAGKSVLASVCIQDLLAKSNQTSSTLVLSHFCDYAQRQEDTEIILKLLLRQLVDQADREILPSLRQHQTEIGSNPRAEHIVKVLSAICSNRRTFLVLDGLDELDAPIPLLPLIQKLCAAGCRVLVMSRDIRDIRRALGSHRELRFLAHPTDLSTFLRGRFQDSDFGERLASDIELSQTLVERANGIFLLAKIFVDWLLSCTTIKKMRKSLPLLPTRLGEAFQSSVERIDRHLPGDRELAYRAIGWVSNAERRLTMRGLLHGLAVEEDLEGEEIDEDNVSNPGRLLKVCVGLLSWNEQDDTVRMVHTSAYEFFRERNFELAQEDLARSCLLYLSADPMNHGPCDDPSRFADRLSKMPFLDYAAKSWGIHAQRTEALISGLIDRFLAAENLRASSWEALQYRAKLASDAMTEASREVYPRGQSALHITGFWNLTGTTHRLLSNGAGPSPQDSQNWTPLHWACERGHEEVAKILIDAGADLEARDSQGFTPLFWAAFRDGAPNVSALLEKEANHLARDNDGWTAAKYAVSNQAQEAVKVLIEFHDQWRESSGRAILVKELSYDQVREYVGDPTEKDLLDVAAEAGNLDAFKFVGENKISPTESFDNIWARGHFDHPIDNIWRLLTKGERAMGESREVEYSVSNRASGDWKTRLLHLAIKDDKLLAVELLLDLGADPNYKIDRAPLHAAAFRKNPAFVEILLKHGADITAHDHHGQTPLHQAITNGFPETVASLIKAGADVNVIRRPRADRKSLLISEGTTPLNLACGLTEPEAISSILRLLIEANADLNSRDNGGRTIVHHAAAHCKAEDIKYLADLGVDLGAVDNEGYNFLHYVAMGRRTSTVDVRSLLELLDHSGILQALDVATPAAHTPLSLTLDPEWGRPNWAAFEAFVDSGLKFSPGTNIDFTQALKSAIIDVQPSAVHLLIELGGKSTDAVPPYSLLSRTNILSHLTGFQLMLKYLQQDGWAINSQDNFGESIMSSLVLSVDSRDLTGYLLDAGADMFVTTNQDRYDRDLCLAVALNGHLENLRCLMKHAEQYARTGHWTSYLAPSLAEEDDAALICRLLDALNGAGILSQLATDRDAFLCEAVHKNNHTLVSVLLDRGASVQTVDEDGWQPLHWAAYHGYAAVVRELLAHGAEVDAATLKWATREDSHRIERGHAWEGTALHLAAMRGDFDIVAYLLDHGANVNANAFGSFQDKVAAWQVPLQGPTALHLVLDTAVLRSTRKRGLSKEQETAMILLERGADITGVADHLYIKDAAEMGRELWERIRIGITEGGKNVDMSSIRLW